ncbi:signal recognition particle [Pyrodictium occultum]|uniref:Signal recognition particle 19 kDa protein n=1 Tax=Pyrodictium occultum TaxID=2309 RepID=A0A0V8RUV1_PYROC|nr:signal recognition particle protein Srp19 [Pyrodictium occultum]KSW11846.1 signal recognition particle [Pyrodictium occultum]
MSREYKGRRVVVWPVYIDSSASRGEGRKVPLRDAVRKPRVEEIVKAAQRLGLNPEVEEARYPRSWWENTKRVVVDKMGSKLNTLKAIAAEIRKLREERRRLRRA